MIRVKPRRAHLYVMLTLVAALVGLMGRGVAWRMLGPGESRADDVRPGEGTLIICGGGPVPDEVRSRLVDLAGGREARILVIPTADPSADPEDPMTDTEFLAPWRRRGVASVRLLHARSRREADDPAFARPLTEATGVWIAGGLQARLAETYAGTAVERGLRALLARGGAIGGNSAGAAAMTRVMIVEGREAAVEGTGLDLLPGAVVDQHFLRRNRVGRLLDLLARHPDRVGFGIDERTALIVSGRRLRVIGSSYVVACLPAGGGRPARFEVLKPGDSADLIASPGPDLIVSSPAELDALLASED